MGDLEEVDPRQAPGEEDRIDALLDVAGQEEALAPEGPEQDDRDVVDAGPGVGRLGRDGVRDPATGRRSGRRPA